jgi:hypothetical protein
MGIDLRVIKGLGADVGHAKPGRIAQPARIDPGSPCARPCRIGLQDQSFCRLDDRAWQRQPVEMTNDKAPCWLQQAADLAKGLLRREPVPALTRRDNIEAGRRKPGLVRRGGRVGDTTPRRAVKDCSLLCYVSITFRTEQEEAVLDLSEQVTAGESAFRGLAFKRAKSSC